MKKKRKPVAEEALALARRLYVESGEPIGLRGVAAQIGLSEDRVERASRRDGWVEARRLFWASVASAAQARFGERLAEQLTEGLEERLKAEEQELLAIWQGLAECVNPAKARYVTGSDARARLVAALCHLDRQICLRRGLATERFGEEGEEGIEAYRERRARFLGLGRVDAGDGPVVPLTGGADAKTG